MKTGNGTLINPKDLVAVFCFNNIYCSIGWFDPSNYPTLMYPFAFDIHMSTHQSQAVYDQLDDSGLFDSETLTKIALLSTTDFVRCITTLPTAEEIPTSKYLNGFSRYPLFERNGKFGFTDDEGAPVAIAFETEVEAAYHLGKHVVHLQANQVELYVVTNENNTEVFTGLGYKIGVGMIPNFVPINGSFQLVLLTEIDLNDLEQHTFRNHLDYETHSLFDFVMLCRQALG